MANRLTIEPLSSAVRAHQGKPTIFLNEEPIPPVVYALTDVPGGRWSWEEVPAYNIRRFAEIGFRLFQLDLFLEHVWQPDGRIDLGLARRQVRGVLDEAPSGAVILRLHVNAPRWWTSQHPEEWTQFADVPVTVERELGFHRLIELDKEPVNRVSLASSRWFQEARDALGRFLTAFARTEEGNALAGVHVACGVFGEWHYWGFFRNEPDTGLPMTRHFRDWLRRKYRCDFALQEAWRDASVTLDTAAVPGMEHRTTVRADIFRQPEAEQRVIDYFRCQHELVAQRIVGFARTVKETWPRPLITGTFYGYLFSMFGRQASGGHLEPALLLDSPWIDYLSGPQCYYPFSTEPGGAYRSRGLLETCRLHGKLWLDEMDQAPDLKWDPWAPGYVGDVGKSVGTLRRNLLVPLTRGHGLWLYDFGVGFHNTGYWDHPELLAEIHRVHEIYRTCVDKPFRGEADVLLVYDTEVFYYLASVGEGDPVTRRILDETTLAFHLSGAALDHIHRKDLARAELARYRAVVLANTFLLTAAEREWIRRELLGAGKSVIFLYAPGYCDGASLNVRFVEETTGFLLRAAKNLPNALAAFSETGWSREPFGIEEPVEPLFTVADPDAQCLAYFLNSDEVAVATKRVGNGEAWFFAVPPTDHRIVREVLRRSGAHLYVREGDVVYAGSGLVCVHGQEGSRRTVELRNGKRVGIDLPPFGTIALDAETGERLL